VKTFVSPKHCKPIRFRIDTIADMAVWPWYGALAKGLVYEAGEFLQVAD
jgi:hypothetical protein